MPDINPIMKAGIEKFAENMKQWKQEDACKVWLAPFPLKDFVDLNAGLLHDACGILLEAVDDRLDSKDEGAQKIGVEQALAHPQVVSEEERDQEKENEDARDDDASQVHYCDWAPEVQNLHDEDECNAPEQAAAAAAGVGRRIAIAQLDAARHFV